MVALAVLAVPLSIAANSRRFRIRQERAIAAIEAKGGLINARPFVCVVDGGRRPVDALILGGPEITDADLEPLAWLTELESLALSGDGVAGPGLVHLEGLRHLKELRFSAATITEASLSHIGKCKNLEKLQFEASGIEERGLATSGACRN